jgi:hypothetical protein
VPERERLREASFERIFVALTTFAAFAAIDLCVTEAAPIHVEMRTQRPRFLLSAKWRYSEDKYKAEVQCASSEARRCVYWAMGVRRSNPADALACCSTGPVGQCGQRRWAAALRPEPDSIAKYLRRVAPSEGRAFQGRSMFPLEGRIRCWRRRGVATGQARATIMMAGRTDSEKPELFVLVREVRGYSGVAPIETRARSYADGVAAQVRSIIDPIRNLHRT